MTRGGRNRCSYFWGSRLSLCTRLGRHFRGLTIGVDQNGANYLSPFYSPEIFGSSPHAIFGPKGDWWPSWLLFSPALLVLWAPAGFRLTCYYYRGAYYKAFWADPPACAVGEPRKGYLGENSFPLIMQNVHRYFLYLALLFILILAHDAWNAMWFAEASGSKRFGIGVGTIVLTLNVILLGGYTFGCHSLRHLIGGFLDEISEGARMRQRLLLRELPEPPPYALGVDEFVLGRFQRPLCSPVLDGHLARLEDLVTMNR